MPDMALAEMIDRAMGALIGGALGDALGMPTQLLSPARIAELYGHVEDFVAPVADHPVSKGLPAGTITDDTEQALLLGRILVVSGDGFDHRRWVTALLDWERGSRRAAATICSGPRPSAPSTPSMTAYRPRKRGAAATPMAPPCASRRSAS
jgi:ADP-ribosylglycohydrolase